MSLRLRNATQTFQPFIDEVLRDGGFCYTYIDDVLVASNSEDEHEQHLRTFFSASASLMSSQIFWGGDGSDFPRLYSFR